MLFYSFISVLKCNLYQKTMFGAVKQPPRLSPLPSDGWKPYPAPRHLSCSTINGRLRRNKTEPHREGYKEKGPADVIQVEVSTLGHVSVTGKLDGGDLWDEKRERTIAGGFPPPARASSPPQFQQPGRQLALTHRQ